MKIGIKRHCLTAAVAALTTGALLQVATASAGLSLSQSPLFLGARVAPNVFIELDDSGSMDWEILTKEHWEFCAYDPYREATYSSYPNNARESDNCGSRQRNGLWRGLAKPETSVDADDDETEVFEYIFGIGDGNTGTNDNVYKNRCTSDRSSLEHCIDQAGYTSAVDKDWRIRSANLNVIYFNPSITYKPWSGPCLLDGTKCADASFNAARSDPREGKGGYTITRDLGSTFGGDGFRYDVWVDDKGYSGSRPRRGSNLNVTNQPNGEVDLWDTHYAVTVTNTGVEVNKISYSPANGSNSDGLNAAETVVTDARERARALGLAADGTVRTVAEIRTNIANWFQYARRRSFVAKGAIAGVLENDPYYRYGLSVINEHNNLFIKVPGTDALIEDYPTHNNDLLGNLFGFTWNDHGTPLRIGLQRTGDYFKMTGDDAPITHECQQNFSVLMTDGYWNGDDPGGIGDEDGDGANGSVATVADVAQYYYDQDLRGDLADNVPSNPLDQNPRQHMVTFTAAFGVQGGLVDTDNDGWPNPPLEESSSAWWSTGKGDQRKIDDLWHAAYNSRGGFVSAKTPQELVEGLQAALANVGERTSSASTIAIDAGVFKADKRLYQARFFGGDWSGELLAYAIGQNGNVSEAAEWNAGDVIDTQNWDSGRVIITSSGGNGIPFRWDSLDESQKAALQVGDGEGEARLEYLRGSKEHEGGGNHYRVRSSRLGDIVHGSPVYVAESPSGHLFQNRVPPIVYVAANDGMLHGFDATTGEEKLAYVPNLIFDFLHELTSPAYTHRYYVDGEPVVADAEFGGGWHTVLVGGLRGGGRGLYALDVTDPDGFSETNAGGIVLWEFTDNQLGYVFGQPAIVKAGDKWVAIVGNGYNSDAQHAVLFVIDVATGTKLAMLDTGIGDAANPNGLASPAPVDTDGDGAVDIVYAGDLLGNLWRFDFDGTWQVAYGGSPLFTAISPELQPQPITTRPEVDEHPTDVNPKGTDKGYLVYFGTGKYIEASDTSTSGQTTQSFYAIWDRNNLNTFQPFDRLHLLRQEIVEETAGLRVTSDNLIFWHDDPATIPDPSATEPTHLGWYIDLAFGANNRGERQVTDSQLRSQKIVFNTMIPSENACDFGGSGWLMVMDATSGSRLTFSPLDVNGDEEFSEADFVQVTIDGEEKKVPVTGRESKGISSAPVIVAGDESSDRILEGNTAPPFRNISLLNPGNEDRGRQTWRLLQLQ